jgi:hypothetical protein
LGKKGIPRRFKKVEWGVKKKPKRKNGDRVDRDRVFPFDYLDLIKCLGGLREKMLRPKFPDSTFFFPFPTLDSLLQAVLYYFSFTLPDFGLASSPFSSLASARLGTL